MDNCSFNRPFDDQTQLRITLILREPFDYTKWRHNFVEKFENMSIEEVSKLAMQDCNSAP